ncbi:MAG: hypothetical protein ACFFCS_18045 [Candidatus Hodarchaeota archaeon]
MEDEKKEKTSARDSVTLKKVKTREQRINLSPEELEMAKKFEQGMSPKQELTNDEITIINILEKQKLLTQRILIKFNQTRAALGMQLLKTQEIQDLVDSLMQKGFVTSRDAPAGIVYYLTEAGLDFLGIM